MDKDLKKKPQTRAEAAESFGKSKEQMPSGPKPYTYVEKVYTYKDGTCRVIEPRYNTSND
jgi:hypothetical protein